MSAQESLIGAPALALEMVSDLGDPRRSKRLMGIIDALARTPDRSFPEIFRQGCELEGFYRFIENPYFTFGELLCGHIRATAERCRLAEEVLVIHDTTEFSFPLRDEHRREHLCRFSKGRQGFFGHLSLAASADGERVPLGIVAARPFVHAEGSTAAGLRFWEEQFGNLACESDRWWEGVESAEAVLGGVELVIHVADRESDIYELICAMVEEGRHFVFRAAQDRRMLTEEMPELGRLFAVLSEQPVLGERTVTVTSRSHARMPPALRKTFPERREREARLCFRAGAVKLQRPQHRPDLGHLPAEVEINVVEAWEVGTPEGEQPIRWVLLTCEGASSGPEVFRVVDIYRSRWLIEEFNKAVKTGCRYEQRQMETADSLLKVLALILPIAWKLLVMRSMERQCPEAPAEAVVTAEQLECLKAALPRRKWSERPGVGEVLLAIAQLGGHLKRNGPPGWLTLYRGYRKLLTLEEGWRYGQAAILSRGTCDQS